MSTASNVTIIPAKVQTEINRDKYHQLRVAAYCRVSTEQEEQQNSYQVQIAYYTDYINEKEEYQLCLLSEATSKLLFFPLIISFLHPFFHSLYKTYVQLIISPMVNFLANLFLTDSK